VEYLRGWIVESRELIILKEDDIASSCKFLLRRNSVLRSSQDTDLAGVKQFCIGLLRTLTQAMADDESHGCLYIKKVSVYFSNFLKGKLWMLNDKTPWKED
jgi:hypothetical protein